MYRALAVGLAGTTGAAAVAAQRRARAAAPAAAPAHLSNAAAVAPADLGPTNATLRQLQVVFRHGARTPLIDDPELLLGHSWTASDCGCIYEAGGARLAITGADGKPSPESKEDRKQREAQMPGDGCCHKGELTRIGQQQALGLGRWLRQRYCGLSGFIPGDYIPGTVAARCTKFSRTRETLRGVLTGLFPGIGPSTPIPVVSSSDIDELLYADTKACPHLALLIKASTAKLRAAESAPGVREERDALQRVVSDAMPLPEGFWSRRWSWTDVHDALTSAAAHGKALPAAMTPAVRREIDLLATRQFAAYLCPSLDDEHGHAMLRLSMGRLFDILVTNLDGAAAGGGGGGGGGGGAAGGNGHSGSGPAKLHLFSGHDSTILPILVALGWEPEANGWPPYLSTICIELWELHGDGGSGNGGPPPTTDGGRFAVRVLFNREPLQLRGCPPDRLMGLSTFKKELLGGFILSEEDHEQACRVPLQHDTPLPHVGGPAAAPSSGNGVDGA